MPALEAHLRQFKPLLEVTVTNYKATRPWWSAHNPRTHLIEGHPDTGGWADLAVTTRWGDRKLVTGLAPAHALPLSGLHAMTGRDGTAAAYLVGLINSTPVQELAEALAPGSISQDDIEDLGLPQFDDSVASKIALQARQLASVVRRLVVEQGPVWPMLPDTLRYDPALAADVTDAWIPAPGRRGWGILGTVRWASLEDSGGRPGGTVESIEATDDLLGMHLIVHFTHGRMLISTDERNDHDLRRLVGRLVAGSGRMTAAQLRALPVPVSADALVAAWTRDKAAVDDLVRHYRELRAAVDEIVVKALDA